MKKILLILSLLFTAWLSFAEGPKYQHKDGNVNMEFQNAYQDIRTKIPIYSSSSFVMTGGTQSTTGILSIKGTNTNDSAAAGWVGEYLSSTTLNFVPFSTSGEYSDLVSISALPGDYSCSGNMYATSNGATVTQIYLGISTTAGNNSTGLSIGDNLSLALPPSSSQDANVSVPSYRVSLSGSSSIYLKCRANYSVATPKARVRISCLRVR